MAKHQQTEFVTRGRLAGRMGCNSETLRYYEQIGLMPAPMRSDGGYRLYDEADRRRLGFILRGRELGFSIRELRGFLDLVDGGEFTCGEIHTLTVRHLEDVKAKIADLCRLEHTLAEIVDRCGGGNVPDCPIIEALYEN